MLCSNCSCVVQPIVAIDIDGTLGDYHGHFLKFAQEYLAWPHGPAGYDGREGFGEWFCRIYGTDLTTFRTIKLAYRQGGLKRNMPIELGAGLMVREVKEAGAEVWLTTTRPYLRLDNVDPDTRFWLNLHGIEFDGMLYDEDKYRKLAEMVDPRRVVAVLDDLPEQCDAAAKEFGVGVPLLRRNRYNYGAHPVHQTVEYLDDARSIIERRVKSWRDMT